LDASDLKFFAAIASSKSLAAAARALDVSPPAVTQRLRVLEARLGIQLVERTGRHLNFTDEGNLLAVRGRDILKALATLSEDLAERRGDVTGRLRVLAPFGFGRRHIAPVIAQFRIKHPGVQVDLLLSDHPGRSSAETWDIAINISDIEGIGA